MKQVITAPESGHNNAEYWDALQGHQTQPRGAIREGFLEEVRLKWIFKE